jgi:hypothetical protein
MKVATKPRVKVADEVWIATALLHRDHPERSDFAIEEIMARAGEESLSGPLRPGVYVHVVQHCVANRPANPGRYRMLFETGSGRRRLFQNGDTYHPSREGSKTTPEADAIPAEYADLLSWYRDWSSRSTEMRNQNDPLTALAGSGMHLWAGERPDDYVRRLREGWE